MKSGWQTNTLGDVLAVIRNGINCKQDKSGNGDRISRIESISDASFDLNKVGYAELSERDKERNRLQPGDILFSHINSAVHVGKTAVIDCDEPVYHGVNLLLMRPKEVVTSAYLNYALMFLFQSGYWRGVCKQSVNQASVNQQDISRVEIHYPKSLTEQQRIVGLLDEAFEGIATAKANAEKNLQNARALFDSHLQTVFTQRGPGWVDKRLGDVLRTGAGGTPLKSKKEYYEGGTIPWLMSGEVSQGEVTSATKFITAKGLENSSAKMFPQDTVLVAMYGATAGAVGILRFEASTNQAVCGILPNDKFVPKFLFYVLLAKKRELIDQATGNAQPNISQIKIKNTEIPVIPLTEQKAVVTALDALSEEIQRLARIYERKLAALEALKKSLLHEAFSEQL